jgi:hypothetical protein
MCKNLKTRIPLRGLLYFALSVSGIAGLAHGQDAKTPYPNMAPVEQYRMERGAEIALAKSAAPPSIADGADVLVMGEHSYETAVHGKNGFVCLVERSWAAGIDDPDFWNPKLRGPICFNPAAARTYMPLTIRKTELVLAGSSKAQMFAAISAAFDKKELPAIEPGAMCYMMSKDGYLADAHGHWHPHLMFFLPLTAPEAWGANQPGSPLLGDKVETDRLSVMLLPVASWSDGTPDTMPEH